MTGIRLGHLPPPPPTPGILFRAKIGVCVCAMRCTWESPPKKKKKKLTGKKKGVWAYIHQNDDGTELETLVHPIERYRIR